MKPEIHPTVYKDAKIACTACGAIFLIPGTVKDQQTEICSNCHPVYTGKYRAASSSGRVARFQKKLASAAAATKEAKPKKRKLSQDEKLRHKLEESRKEKKEKKKLIAERDHARAKRAAEKTVVKHTDVLDPERSRGVKKKK